jgi:hypothetical protein
MDADTLAALKGSIAKWQAIVDGTGYDFGIQNCPLCLIFHPAENGKPGCRGCPVREATGRRGCIGTPYEALDKADAENDKEAAATHAQAELDFLKSLLPPRS